MVDEVEIPKLEHGKALVEIKSTRICGSQLGEIDGVKGLDHYLPHLLGHEAGGVVREVGPDLLASRKEIAGLPLASGSRHIRVLPYLRVERLDGKCHI